MQRWVSATSWSKWRRSANQRWIGSPKPLGDSAAKARARTRVEFARLVPELICADIERSVRFYTGVLGFHVRYARPEERFAYLEREGAEIMLEQPTGRMFLVG